ncbi:MAG: AAA-like domain-containing protein [Sulfurovum sp.]
MNKFSYLIKVDNIELVTSVSSSLTYERDKFKSSDFVHYFIKSITQSTKEKGSDITLEYIGGHPYLTRKVLYEMATENIDLIEALCVGRFDEHLRRYLIIFQHNPNLIETIKEVIKGDCPDIEKCSILEATGFITNSMNDVRFSSKLYQEFFERYF